MVQRAIVDGVEHKAFNFFSISIFNKTQE